MPLWSFVFVLHVLSLRQLGSAVIAEVEIYINKSNCYQVPNMEVGAKYGGW